MTLFNRGKWPRRFFTPNRRGGSCGGQQEGLVLWGSTRLWGLVRAHKRSQTSVSSATMLLSPYKSKCQCTHSGHWNTLWHFWCSHHLLCVAIGAIGPTIGAIGPDLDSAGACHRGKSAIGAIGAIGTIGASIGALSEHYRRSLSDYRTPPREFTFCP